MSIGFVWLNDGQTKILPLNTVSKATGPFYVVDLAVNTRPRELAGDYFPAARHTKAGGQIQRCVSKNHWQARLRQ